MKVTNSSLLFAFAYALVGLGVGIFVTVTAIGDYRFFFLFSTASAFITAYLLWTFIMEKRIHKLKRFALVTGGLSGILSHYVCWYFLYVSANVCYWSTGGCTGSLGEAPANLVVAFVGAFALSFWSLLLFGWLTISAGMVIAMVMATYFTKQRIEK